MKAKMKPHKLLSMLLALVMVVGMLPAMGQVAYAGTSTVYITKIEINNFNPEFHSGMTGTAAKNSLTFSYPDDANYSKGNDNRYIKQNGSYIYGNNLTAGAATLIIYAYANPFSNNEENPAYDFDEANLNSIEVWINGEKRTDVEVKEYNSAWRFVGIYIPVTVSEYTSLNHTVSFAANGGTGSMADVTGVSGDYVLPVCGFTAPNGKQFKAWSVGGVEKAVGDKITVTANTTVTAVWEAIEYNVTVTGGTASVGAGTPITKATMGTTVTLTANKAPDRKVFDKWEVVSGSITLADANSATTTFTMPAGEVSVKATYKDPPTVIDTVAVRIDTPVAGTNPKLAVSNTENVSVYTTVWGKLNGGGFLTETDTFVEGDPYRAIVMLEAGQGYVFAENPTVIVNGSATSTATIINGYIYFAADFTAINPSKSISVKDIQNSDTLTFKVDLKSDETITGIIIAAVYDNDGKFIAVSSLMQLRKCHSLSLMLRMPQRLKFSGEIVL